MLDKIDSFLKNFQMSLAARKVDYIFGESLNLHTIFVSFFSFLCGFQEKRESSLRWGAQYPDTQNTLIIFLSAIALMQVIFLTEYISALYLIRGIHSTTNSKS